ncbi:16S rRNA (guanine(527)-N(7))-methyltransferase RsmG [Rubellimicrobium roseum]|uniref:Ribosomal RNA small subunit methyltransferase G n=1 Tax=Rubellimicrobium roseum TaxID=687525 RepID=A0A5C4NLN6_9RHOB|nr:16S rRNA (guanine(527)-N(7))-methyltransferase RsmG [Rubellimicrobium roseum]TNC74298.1 16S rRNA (guanine(527)-N(7))-methyltransferase RsmG [Rubellimicrobium roseum]
MTPTRDLAGLNLSPTARARLEAFEALARRWTGKINLVAPSTVPDLWTRHILDSAQLWPLAPPEAQTWADLGSGGGFPGIVVAILAAEAGTPKVTLIESDQRKCAFLRTAARELGVPVTVLDQRAESAPPQATSVVSARALAPLATLLPLVARHLAPGGTALLPKGRDHAAEIEAARAKGWRFAVEALPSATDPEARLLRLTDLAHG